MVPDGDFREDLLFRLRVVDIQLPPLRDRGSDVLLLARHFLSAAAGGVLRLSTEAEGALLAYPWPGNVRELANAIERATIFSSGNVVRFEDLPADLKRGPVVAPGGSELPAQLGDGVDIQTAKARATEQFERTILTAALQTHGGNVSQAARSLGLHRQNVRQKLRRLGISAADFRKRD